MVPLAYSSAKPKQIRELTTIKVIFSSSSFKYGSSITNTSGIPNNPLRIKIVVIRTKTGLSNGSLRILPAPENA